MDAARNATLRNDRLIRQVHCHRRSREYLVFILPPEVQSSTLQKNEIEEHAAEVHYASFAYQSKSDKTRLQDCAL